MAEETAKHILEPSGTEIATAAGGARRYRKALKDLRWSDIKAMLSESFDEWSRHKAPRLGASLAFYTLLSLAPLMLVVVSIVGLVFGHGAAERDVVQQVQMLIGPAGAKAIQAVLEGSHNTTHGILATMIGLITLLFGASGVLIELRDALNTIWEVPSPTFTGMKKITAFIKERLFSFAIVLSIGFLLVVSLAVSAWIAALGSLSASVLPGEEVLLHVMNTVVSFVIITGLFASIYKIMPDVPIEWRDVILGGAATSLLFTLGKLLLALYLGKASIASSYGAAASLVILVVWVYYSGQIFFFGAELTRSFANCYGSQPGSYPEGMVKAATATATGPGLTVEPSTGKKIILPSGRE
ncbi:MAG: YihY/virulence factor BrkB family protein [Acidobacteriaceae bacterium]|nr:YihY/virulence factor BrkB family protein [Acidobacteriaceae bacterium]MBV9780835.1 YihY/virulence factor BrkB family protein [Acidobacteriaceae bacterium]